MSITVFGASGGIGGHVTTLAAQRGHHIRAIYRAVPATPPLGQAEITNLHQRLARTLITAVPGAAPQARLICVTSLGPAARPASLTPRQSRQATKEMR